MPHVESQRDKLVAFAPAGEQQRALEALAQLLIFLIGIAFERSCLRDVHVAQEQVSHDGMLVLQLVEAERVRRIALELVAERKAASDAGDKVALKSLLRSYVAGYQPGTNGSRSLESMQTRELPRLVSDNRALAD